jgi:hypothetical protein
MPKTALNRVPAPVPFHSDAATVTIGKLARAAEVGVETVRYYQRRRLLAVPQSAGGARRYPAASARPTHEHPRENRGTRADGTGAIRVALPV